MIIKEGSPENEFNSFSDRDMEDFRPQQETVDGSIESESSTEHEWTPKFGVIIISGPPGSGTSSVATRLVERYDIPRGNFIKIGDLRRDIYRDSSSQELIGPIEEEHREVRVDEKLDEITTNAVRNSSFENPFIIEAQLGGYIAKKALDQLIEREVGVAPVVKILFQARPLERARRIQEREKAKDPSYHMSLKELRRFTRDRTLTDISGWQEAHPELEGINPLSTKNKDENGEPIYDHIIDTSDLNLEEVVDRLHNWLKQLGLVNKNLEFDNEEDV